MTLEQDPDKQATGEQALSPLGAKLRRLFYNYWNYGREFPPETFAELIPAYPGAGKTTAAMELSNLIWKEGKLPALYLMLSHQIMDEMQARLEAWGVGQDWQRWRGHADGCPAKDLAELGYAGQECNCSHVPTSTFKAEKPTFAPINYLLHDPWQPPLVPQVLEFALWIIDEIDLNRFVQERDISSDGVRKVGDTYPNPLVKTLCAGLADVLDSLTPDQELEGLELCSRLRNVLEARKLGVLEAIVEELRADITSLPIRPWQGLRPPGRTELGGYQFASDPPPNFVPPLVYLLSEELRIGGDPANPRIHLTRGASGGSWLRLRWRKVVTNGLEVPERVGALSRIAEKYIQDPDALLPLVNPLTPFLLVLDATANPELLRRVFPHITEANGLPAPEWPAQVIVHQDAGNRAGRRQVGLWPSNDPTGRKPWYKRMRSDLDKFTGELPVGIISYKDIIETETEAVEFLRLIGFTAVKSLYYGNERSSNELKEVRILVLLGCPIPNPDLFKWEAQAFLFDAQRLNFERVKRKEYLRMRQGWSREIEINEGGDDLVQAYFNQKCEAGLYQAVCRIRPYDPSPMTATSLSTPIHRFRESWWTNC